MEAMIRRSALLLLLLGAAPASADALRDQAKVEYDTGRREFELAHYDWALQSFERSYRLAPIPDLLYNIGRCQEELGQRAAAALSYRQYLAAKPKAEEAAELGAHIAELERGPPGPRSPPIQLHAVEQRATPVRAVAPSRPIWRRAWLWVVVVGAALVAAAAVAVAVVASSPSPAPIGLPAVTTWH
jgi:tetratricopeptide (TPR) repeat protein